MTNYLYATSQLAQTTLRSVLGEVELDELLAQREKLNTRLQTILDEDTEPWGIKVTKVEVKQVDLPDEMKRAIAKQAEAERERRAKIIHAEGEYQAASRLTAAAAIISEQPVAVTLRYLQTLTEIGVEQNTTIVFPLPCGHSFRLPGQGQGEHRHLAGAHCGMRGLEIPARQSKKRAKKRVAMCLSGDRATQVSLAGLRVEYAHAYRSAGAIRRRTGKPPNHDHLLRRGRLVRGILRSRLHRGEEHDRLYWTGWSRRDARSRREQRPRSGWRC